MELKKIAFGWLKDALEATPPGTWILIADGHPDYYTWTIGLGTQKDVETAYTEQGGTIALTYQVIDCKANMVRPQQAVCPRCGILSSKRMMVNGVCSFCDIENGQVIH